MLSIKLRNNKASDIKLVSLYSRDLKYLTSEFARRIECISCPKKSACKLTASTVFMLLTCIVHVKKHEQMKSKQKESLSFQRFLPFFVVQQYFLYPLLSLFLLSSLPPNTNFTLPFPCFLPSYFCFDLPFLVLSLHFQFFLSLLLFIPHCTFSISLSPFTISKLFPSISTFFFSWSISVLFLCLSICLSCYSPISCF